MANDLCETEDLEREIERLQSANPHLENLLAAFGPQILEKNRWLSETAVEAQTPPIDPLRYSEGIPINQQHRLFVAEDPWGSAAWSAITAIVRGFPHLGEDMGVLLGQISQGDYASFSPLFADNEEGDGELAERAASLGLSPVSLHLFLRVLNRFMLTKKARDFKRELTAHVWKKGYCPVCGGFPHLAILGDAGQRLLHCPDCGHNWPFARLACPYCDHQDPQETNIFFIEGQKENSAFTCGKCRRYLLTANRSASLGQLHADLIAIGLVHLDLILQEKGFSPMSKCEWNSFDGNENRRL